MNVKTYQSKSLQEALNHIKRDLGSDALILSTREVRPARFLAKAEVGSRSHRTAESTRTGGCGSRGRRSGACDTEGSTGIAECAERIRYRFSRLL